MMDDHGVEEGAEGAAAAGAWPPCRGPVRKCEGRFE